MSRYFLRELLSKLLLSVTTKDRRLYKEIASEYADKAQSLPESKQSDFTSLRLENLGEEARAFYELRANVSILWAS